MVTPASIGATQALGTLDLTGAVTEWEAFLRVAPSAEERFHEVGRSEEADPASRYILEDSPAKAHSDED